VGTRDARSECHEGNEGLNCARISDPLAVQLRQQGRVDVCAEGKRALEAGHGGATRMGSKDMLAEIDGRLMIVGFGSIACTSASSGTQSSASTRPG